MQGPEWGETMRMPRVGRDVEKGPEWGEMIERPGVGRYEVKGPEWNEMMCKVLSGAT